jgi:hypothetical protein
MENEELSLMADADRRAADYVRSIETRRVFPSPQSIEALSRFDEALPETGLPAAEALALLDDIGSPATVTTNGPR